MIRLPCSKCGTVDYPKYRRIKLRENGKRTPMMSSYCILCHKEEAKIIEQRRYKKKLAYNRQWRKENRKKVNKYQRDYYIKKTRSNWGEGSCVFKKSKKEHKVSNYKDFSFRNFDFRNRSKKIDNMFLTEII